MPFKSKAQQRWMYANEPGMAKRWSDHTSDHKSLPEKAKKKKEKKAALTALRKMAAISHADGPIDGYEAPGGIEEWASWPSIGGQMGAGYGIKGGMQAYVKKVLGHTGPGKGQENAGFRFAPNDKHSPWVPRDTKGYGLGKIPGFGDVKDLHGNVFKSQKMPTKAIEDLRELLNVYGSKPGRTLPEVFTDTSSAANRVIGQMKPKASLSPIGKLIRTMQEAQLKASPAYYYPGKRPLVSLSGGAAADPHILAHELGHATQHKFLRGKLFKALRTGGKGAAVAGNLGVLGTDDSAKARDYALLSNAGALPTLGMEAHASGKGSQLMKELAKKKGTWDKLKGMSKLKHRLGAWKGFPTYAALGIGMPWLTYAIKNSLGGYGKPK